MMATLQKKEECGKGLKKTFAPPTQKLHSMIPCGPDLPMETLGISSPEAEVKPSLPKARLEKKKEEEEEEEEAATEHGPSLGQDKKRKARDNKPAEKNEKEKLILTNAEFEEIVQTVLRKSLKECLETSCVKPTMCIQSDKETEIAASATDDDIASGESVMVPQVPEISASLKDEVTPDKGASEPGLAILASSEKKHNRLYLNKRKKQAQDEKMETTQSGSEYRQTDQLNNMIQNRSQTQTRVQKKRKGSGFDVNYNCCDIPEEAWTGPESEVVYACYVPGSIVWAKQYGYPWWPGMIESDPDLGEYFLFASHLHSVPERVNLFGFWSRYCEPDSNEDLTLPEANSPKPYMEEEEEEEKEKKDPSLPGTKSAKIKTKNPKLRGSKKKFQIPQSKTSAVILSEEKEVRIVPKGLSTPAHYEAFPLEGKERSRPQEPLILETKSVCLEDEASSDLDLEQIMEDLGRKSQ
ncbi:Zinc finger CW-type PWWP domain protein 1 [Fukomys damarensis]|uniref:Zinc finger CW-type PWWP domain protein 1 n=1 Tax=Fukomys damarensis TaxID=885580 RepID=A0A091EMK9_FUKDA|nr:Zinc finger CW-type PWWP domain protein 1 [Fukomys damarensis]